MNKVSVAFIGMGYRGKQLFRLLRNIPFFQILAVADPGMEPSELPDISCYNHGENSSLEMLEKHHPELVFIASPWQYHVQHALLCVEPVRVSDKGLHFLPDNIYPSKHTFYT